MDVHGQNGLSAELTCQTQCQKAGCKLRRARRKSNGGYSTPDPRIVKAPKGKTHDDSWAGRFRCVHVIPEMLHLTLLTLLGKLELEFISALSLLLQLRLLNLGPGVQSCLLGPQASVVAHLGLGCRQMAHACSRFFGCFWIIEYIILMMIGRKGKGALICQGASSSP